MAAPTVKRRHISNVNSNRCDGIVIGSSVIDSRTKTAQTAQTHEPQRRQGGELHRESGPNWTDGKRVRGCNGGTLNVVHRPTH
jgi:hypothetical protein